MKKGIAAIPKSLIIFWNITNFVDVTNGFQVIQTRSNYHLNTNSNTHAITSSRCTKLFGSHHHNSRSRDYSSYDSSSGMNFIERDADFGEILAGGQRYEMVELPDSMLDTTIFVGNLCEVSSHSNFLVCFVSHIGYY